MFVLFRDKNPILYILEEGIQAVAGIVITSESRTRLLISVNTNNTSVTGIRCVGNTATDSDGVGATEDSDTLNLTIYGK